MYTIRKAFYVDVYVSTN